MHRLAAASVTLALFCAALLLSKPHAVPSSFDGLPMPGDPPPPNCIFYHAYGTYHPAQFCTVYLDSPAHTAFYTVLNGLVCHASYQTHLAYAELPFGRPAGIRRPALKVLTLWPSSLILWRDYAATAEVTWAGGISARVVSESALTGRARVRTVSFDGGCDE